MEKIYLDMNRLYEFLNLYSHLFSHKLKISRLTGIDQNPLAKSISGNYGNIFQSMGTIPWLIDCELFNPHIQNIYAL